MTDFGIKLLQWYRENQRQLPWRATKDPYKIWLSEIILQQTQVVQGTAYYLRFIEQFPHIHDLASAREENVLKLWQGLGYYSRARNLHATAQVIVKDYDGRFPQTYQDIIKLKGIGPYTAAAIASFCFNQPHASVDGNVYRFLSRLKGVRTPIDSTDGKKEFAILAHELLNQQNPGDHNQAMIEFGALMCRPSSPSCVECPFNGDCMALAQNSVAELPVKTKKIIQRKRYFNYFFIEEGGVSYLEKRVADDIWRNLYQLPMVETTKKVSSKKLFKQRNVPLLLLDERKHVLSHQVIFVSFYRADKRVLEYLDGTYLPVSMDDISKYPVSQLVANFLSEKIGVHQD